jgi:hypothetical protein
MRRLRPPSLDERGNSRLMGLDRNARAIIVVIAGDDPDSSLRLFRMTDMRADYDSKANAISIELVKGGPAERQTTSIPVRSLPCAPIGRLSFNFFTRTLASMSRCAPSRSAMRLTPRL